MQHKLFGRHLPEMLLKRWNRGYCPICEARTIFIEHEAWLRDHYKCTGCNSIPRERALITTMNTFVPGWQLMSIHESSPGTRSSDYVRKKCKHYSFSYYFPGIPPGSSHNGIRCENLEGLTFNDTSFDIFITQDVFEHVMRPREAFREVGRVLKPNGIHIFTVPFYRDLAKSRPRVGITGDRVEYKLKPVYHGNPISPEGSLVTWDYGRDLPGFIFDASGLYTTAYHTIDRGLGIDGEFLEVFISQKPPMPR